ncbi:hypothetical protein LPJ66_010533, partial [Kickxella alabastrina]
VVAAPEAVVEEVVAAPEAVVEEAVAAPEAVVEEAVAAPEAVVEEVVAAPEAVVEEAVAASEAVVEVTSARAVSVDSFLSYVEVVSPVVDEQIVNDIGIFAAGEAVIAAESVAEDLPVEELANSNASTSGSIVEDAVESVPTVAVVPVIESASEVGVSESISNEIIEPIAETFDITESSEPSFASGAAAPANAADPTETAPPTANDNSISAGISVAAGTDSFGKRHSPRPRALFIAKEPQAVESERKPLDEVDSVINQSTYDRDLASASAVATDGVPPVVTTPSYIMHYPESLFGDASSIAPALITIEDLQSAQKAHAVVGVSAINATSTGRRSRDSGYQAVDSEVSVSQRMKRFISGRRSEALSKLPKSPLRSSGASEDGKRMSVSASTTTVGVEEHLNDDNIISKIPGSFPSEHNSDNEAAGQAKRSDAEHDESAGSSDAEQQQQPSKDKRRRHTIFGVIKSIFR